MKIWCLQIKPNQAYRHNYCSHTEISWLLECSKNWKYLLQCLQSPNPICKNKYSIINTSPLNPLPLSLYLIPKYKIENKKLPQEQIIININENLGKIRLLSIFDMGIRNESDHEKFTNEPQTVKKTWTCTNHDPTPLSF